MNETTKYGLAFLGGVVVGALGAVALSRGKLNIKPLATDLISNGMDLRDKIMAGVEGVKEDIADVVAEAEVKAQERKMAQEAQEAQKATSTATTTRSPLNRVEPKIA